MRRDRHCESGMEIGGEKEVVALPDNRDSIRQQNRAFEWTDRPALFCSSLAEGSWDS